jgi:hypothetical protein
MTKNDQLVSQTEHMHNLADTLCKNARTLPEQKTDHSLPANTVELTLNVRVITAHTPKAISKAFHSINLKGYYKHKHQWSGAIIDSIWWKAYGKSLALFNQPDKLRIQKFTNDCLPTCKRAYTYCKDQSCLCHTCYTEVEDGGPHPKMQNKRKTAIKIKLADSSRGISRQRPQPRTS